MITIDVAKEFSKTPIGRDINDSDFNGERFRDTVLEPLLREYPDEEITVDFNGISITVGSSFLEETFGGLVRKGYDASELLKKITVIDQTGFYQRMTISMIKMAEKDLQK